MLQMQKCLKRIHVTWHRFTPESMKLVLEAGKSTLFVSLHAILGVDYASSLCGKRERKRLLNLCAGCSLPEYYFV